MKKFLVILVAVVLTLSAVSAAFADTDWPKKAVTVYVPASAGGTTDLTARWICEKLEEHFGQPFVIVNQTGSSGGVAADTMMDCAPDGYNLMLFHNTMMTAYVTGAVEYKATEVMRVMNCLTHNYPDSIVVRADSKYQTIEELIDALVNEPGTVKIGVEMGAGSHMMAAAFQTAVGGQFNIMDCGSDTDRIAALMGNHLDMIFMNTGMAKDYVESGDFKILAVVGDVRNPNAPDAPTVVETGYPFSWGGQFMAMFAQQDIPEEIVEKLNGFISELLATPEADEYFNSFGFYVDYKDSEEATAAMNGWLDAILPLQEVM